MPTHYILALTLYGMKYSESTYVESVIGNAYDTDIYYIHTKYGDFTVNIKTKEVY